VAKGEKLMNRIIHLTSASVVALSAVVCAGAALADEPVTGGVVRFAVKEESRGLDPVTSHRRFSEAAIHIQDSLVLMNVDNEPFGALAESWSVNEDATEYTVKLKDNVTFHDGSKLDADAVKAHFTRVFDKEFCCSNATQYMGPYVETKVIDPLTLTIVFSKPWGPFSHYIGLLDVTAIPSNMGWEEKGIEMNLSPVGVGPFKFVEWVPQSHISVTRNEDYAWGSDLFENKGAPYLDGLEVKFIADHSTRSACLESGDCDIIKDPSYPDLRRISGADDYQIVKIPQTGMPFSFVFNTAKWPTDTVQVRKAINLAIDREKINIAAFLGERDPLYTTLAPHTPEFWSEGKSLITYDPNTAAALIEEAGLSDTDGDGVVDKDGMPAEIELFVFGNKDSNPSIIVAEAIQADIAVIGIRVNINVRPWDDQSVVAMNEEHHMVNFDMPLPTASVLGVMFNSRETPSEGKYGMGFTWFQKADPDASGKLDAFLDAGDNSATFEERKANFDEAQKIIGENYLGVPISAGFTTYVMDKNLKGVKYNNGGHAMFNDAYFAGE